MSREETDTHRIERPHADRRHESTTTAEVIALLERVQDRLHALEKANRDAKQDRHDANTHIHQIIGDVTQTLEQHQSKIEKLTEIARETSASLHEIKALLAGSFGQTGLALRVKEMEVQLNDAIQTIGMLKWVCGLIAAPLGTAIGGAVVWLLFKAPHAATG